MSDSADVAANSNYLGTTPPYEVERDDGSLGPPDSYFVNVAPFNIYLPSNLLSPNTVSSHVRYREFCCDFPYNQLPVSFAGKVQANLVLVFGQLENTGATEVEIRQSDAPASAVANAGMVRGTINSDGGISGEGGDTGFALSASVRMASGRRVSQRGGHVSFVSATKRTFGHPRWMQFTTFFDPATASAARVELDRLHD